MEYSEISNLLELAKLVLRNAIPLLDQSFEDRASHLQWHGREPKIQMDHTLNSFVSSGLESAGIPILSEEGHHVVDWRNGRPVWILDPLDGTLNFARGTGPSAISVALWCGCRPKFGVLLDIDTHRLCWGGRDIGAWRDGLPLRASGVRDTKQGILCTGIPSSFDFGAQEAVARWVEMMSHFGKVRMIGSAASSLALLAAGAVECYFESNIKVWDVAAGLALVEGAGGVFQFDDHTDGSFDVIAMNGVLGLPPEMMQLLGKSHSARS